MNSMVVAFPCLSDNIGILFHDPSTGATAAVDVPDAAPVLTQLADRGWKLTHILITHKHNDHIGGLLDLKMATGATVFGPAAERAVIAGLDIGVSDGDQVNVGGYSLQVIGTPGHTLGHVVYFEPNRKWLFSGDTLFLMGCGRIFEGTPEQMFASLEKIAALPPETTVWFGHEYSKSNSKFANYVDNKNPDVQFRISIIENQLNAGHLTVPTTIGDELLTNPFLRCDNHAIRSRLGINSSVDLEVFTDLRELKDRF